MSGSYLNFLGIFFTNLLVLVLGKKIIIFTLFITKLPQPQPSYYPAVFHGRILYYSVYIIQVSLMTEYYMLVAGDRRHGKSAKQCERRSRKFLVFAEIGIPK